MIRRTDTVSYTHLFTKMQQKIDELNSTVQENITNVRVVKSFVRENYEEEKFTAANSRLKKAGMSAYKMMIGMQPVMTICMNLTTVAVLWIGGQLSLIHIYSSYWQIDSRSRA